jgi:HD-like signal output (HDOD) protein
METTCTTGLTSLSDALISKLNDGDIKLPVLPAVATQVIGMASNETTNLSELSELIHKDQALAGHVLRIANSALFAGNVAVVSLQQAIARLGVNMIGEMAAVISIKGQVFKAKGFENLINQVWEHALLSGFFSKEIARASRRNVEAQFLCGLLHTIGKPVLFQMIADLKATYKFEVKEETVRDLTNTLAPRAGQLAAVKWELPRQVQACCAFTFCREKANKFKDPVCMTYLANRLGHWCQSEEEIGIDDIRKDPVMAELNFYPDEVEALIEKREAVEKVVQTMMLS